MISKVLIMVPLMKMILSLFKIFNQIKSHKRQKMIRTYFKIRFCRLLPKIVALKMKPTSLSWRPHQAPLRTSLTKLKSTQAAQCQIFQQQISEDLPAQHQENLNKFSAFAKVKMKTTWYNVTNVKNGSISSALAL